ncbi:MAG: hypothetical protein IT427_15810 [Pirellulales bacterium]|nr:hypothetical protein [Pirellulales bacterium]
MAVSAAPEASPSEEEPARKAVPLGTKPALSDLRTLEQKRSQFGTEGSISEHHQGDIGLHAQSLEGGVSSTTLMRGLDNARTAISADEAVKIAADGYLFVTLKVTPEAARRHEFSQVLSKHQIAVEVGSEKETSQQSRSQDAGGIGLDSELRRWAQDVQSGETHDELYFVEAPPQQIAAALGDLASANESFPSIELAKRLPLRKATAIEKQQSQEPTKPTKPDSEATTSVSSSAGTFEKPPSTSYILDKPLENNATGGSETPAIRRADQSSGPASGRAARVPLPQERFKGYSAVPLNAPIADIETDRKSNRSASPAFAPADGRDVDKLEVFPKSNRIRQIRALFVIRIVEPTPAATSSPNTEPPAAPR